MLPSLAPDAARGEDRHVREPSWQFVDADAVERLGFSDFVTTVARAGDEPVAPPNRLRAVFLLHGDDGRRYYLKRFARTQVGNLFRNLLTRPRCRHDAWREVLVAGELRRVGFATPRVVAVGLQGAESVCLLAELPGEELRARIVGGRCPGVLAMRVARHCGRIAAAGVTLPDLSALHVFVDGDDPTTAELAVLDLHRGAGMRPRRRDLVRMLRSFGRSVKGLAIARTAALRFAVTLLRAAGRGPQVRAIVRRLPPFDTHGRYDAAGRAARYGERSSRRAARERALLGRVWPTQPGESVLDLPCGRGRLGEFVASHGAHWHGADRAQAMLAAARAADARAPLVCADAMAFPFADASFDGVIVFRFLHHLPAAPARSACTEAARVAARFVVVSFFHPCSAHAIQRSLACWFLRRARTRFTRPLREVDRWFAAVGYARTRVAAESAYRRDLWIACYERVARVSAR